MPMRPPIALLVLLLAACAAPSRRLPNPSPAPMPGADGQVLTTLDLLAAGEHAVQHYFATLPPAERARVDRAMVAGAAATVRLSVRVRLTSFSFEGHSGSGVLLADGDDAPLVLTAGHTFAETGDHAETVLAVAEGVQVPATMLTQIFADGADYSVLRCGDRDLERRARPAAAAASLTVGTPVLALGYPDSCGRTADGRIAREGPDLDRDLQPLVTVLQVAGTDPLLLRPVAGALPLGGFSGGGLFDFDGNVIGVLTGTQWTPDDEALDVRVTGHALAAMQWPR